jgi:hypothetical protein
MAVHLFFRHKTAKNPFWRTWFWCDFDVFELSSTYFSWQIFGHFFGKNDVPALDFFGARQNLVAYGVCPIRAILRLPYRARKRFIVRPAPALRKSDCRSQLCWSVWWLLAVMEKPCRVTSRVVPPPPIVASPVWYRACNKDVTTELQP